MPQIVKAMRRHFALQAFCRHHHRGGGAVEPAQPAPDPFFRHQRKARIHIIGKAGVKGGGKGDAIFQADGARRQAQRAFGGDMHRIGREVADFLFQHGAGKQRQADFRIGRQRHG